MLFQTMNKLIRKLLIYILILFPLVLAAQNSYSDKIVNFPANRITLKAALKILSNQTGCVFSYDPTKINDRQNLSTPTCHKITLQAALQKILPKNIRFKLKGKYVVLQKAETTKAPTGEPISQNKLQHPKLIQSSIKTNIVVSETTINKNTSDSKNNFSKLVIDSVKQNEEIIQLNSPSEKLTKTDSVQTPATIKPDLQLIVTHSPDTLKITKPKSQSIFELEFAVNNHLATFSTHIGLNNIYSIISVGTDYYQSQHLGVGVGTNIKLYKHLGVNIDLIQYALVAGRSAKIKVKVATTQLSTTLNYSIGKRLKIFAGPSLYRINSKYVRGGSNIDLGKSIEYSAILGVKIDLAKRQKRNT